jgi:hypothetical protein
MLKVEILLILILNWILKNIKSSIEKFINKYYYKQQKIRYTKHKKLLKKSKLYNFLKNIILFKKYQINFVFYTTTKQNTYRFFFF